MPKTIYVGACRCGCGAQIWDEVEEIRCEKCGTFFAWSKMLKSTMKQGGCGNCGALLFYIAGSVPLPTLNTSEVANFRHPDGATTAQTGSNDPR